MGFHEEKARGSHGEPEKDKRDNPLIQIFGVIEEDALPGAEIGEERIGSVFGRQDDVFGRDAPGDAERRVVPGDAGL